MKRLLLTEYCELCSGGVCDDLLTESEKIRIRQGKILFPALLQTADVKNGNGRVYARSILERENSLYQKLIVERRSLGEIDHPAERTEVSVKEASHLITRTWWDGHNLQGIVEILNTPNGKIVQTLLNDGVKLGISSRGVGSLREGTDGILEVEDDYMLVCWDIVSDPSTPDAYLMTESRTNEYMTRADRINRLLSDIVGY